MRFLQKLGFYPVLVLVALSCFWFGIENSDDVSLVFFGYATVQAPVTLWVLSAFVLGVVFASFVNMWTNVGLRRDAAKVKSQLLKTNLAMDKVQAKQRISNSGVETG